MSEGFERTRETASNAKSLARLLIRAAEAMRGIDAMRLVTLADRYDEYADALLAALPAEGPEPEQAPLL